MSHGRPVDGFVFVDELGKYLRKMSLFCLLRRCCKRAGVKVLPPKALRHSFASLHVMMGTNLPEVSKMIGHYSIAFTLDTYTHWVNEKTKTNSQVALANRIKQAAEEAAEEDTGTV
jgi:site-specific recombinase XerD